MDGNAGKSMRRFFDKWGILVFAPILFLWLHRCSEKGMTHAEFRAETLRINAVIKIKTKEIRYKRRFLIGEKVDSTYVRFVVEELKELHEDARPGDWFVKIEGDSLFHLFERRASGQVIDHIYFRPYVSDINPVSDADSSKQAAVQYDSLESLLKTNLKL